MNYYALFLNTNGFIEQCLALIRYICNPNSRNYPHITVRVYKSDPMGIEEMVQNEITYVNMIEPGAFNLEKENAQYTVYIRFESEQLEMLDYKPDFPMSFMHLTLYDGDNKEFAVTLLDTLKSVSWKAKLSFDRPLCLTKSEIGKKITTDSYKKIINDISENILGYPRDEMLKKCDSIEGKLSVIKTILEAFKEYYYRERIDIPESMYASDAELEEKNNKLFFYGAKGKKIIKDDAKNTIYVTPPEYAKEMAEIAFKYLDLEKEIRFGDSAIGTGTLFLALLSYGKQQEKGLKIESAIGVDIDKNLALEAKRRYSGRNLKVVWGDSLLPQMDPYLGKKRSLMLVNPPYSRASDIDPEYRKALQKYLYKQTGLTVNGRAALYVYHIMIMDKWLDDDGIAVWLIPSVFMETQYGKSLRIYLLNNVRLLQIHLYSEDRVQFEKAMVSTCLLVFKKTDFFDNDEVIISIGDSIYSSPDTSKCVTRKKLREEIDNWRNVLNEYVTNNTAIEDKQNKTVFSDLFDIKRGLATGANDFFVMTVQESMDRGIPKIALKPLLPKARYLTSLIIEGDEEGYPNCEPQLVLLDCDMDEESIKSKYPKFYYYLQQARKKTDGKAIVDRTLVKARTPWYKQEAREAPMYLMTYMGRKKKDLPPLYFLLNRTKAIALNTYICLYPKAWLKDILEQDSDLQEEFLEILNLNAKDIIPQQTRKYSGSFQKMEPNVLKQIEINGLPSRIKKATEENVIKLKLLKE